MSEFKSIVQYFRFSRRGEKADKETAFVPVFLINETYNAAIETDIKEKGKSFFSSDFCHKISSEISDYRFYFRKATAGHYVYYIKENESNNPKYRRIPMYLNSDWEELPNEEIEQLVEIRDGFNTFRYFDKQEEIAFEIQLSNVTVFPDHFFYHPEDIKVSDGEYLFDYLDHEGYDNTIGDWALRVLSEKSYETYRNYKFRQVDFFKKNKVGYVHLFPKLTINLLGNYVLRYAYYEKGISHNSFMAERAVKLRFNYFGAFLEYLNQTIFYALDNPSSFESTNRQLFLAEYMEIVYQLLKQAKGDDVLKVLYYVPIGFFEKINSKFLWNVLDVTLKGNVTNAGTNKEDIVLRILDGLAKSMNNNEVFLNELLKKHGEKETRFSLLYDKLNGDNFKTFVSFTHSIWFQSSYRNPDNKLYKKTDEKYNIEESPFVVNYEAKKEATFFYSNKNIIWVDANILKFEPDTSWWDEIASVLNPAIGEVVKQFTETEKSFYYHPFQPIAINNFDKQQTGVELTSPLMPAFVLKAGEDKAFWDNVVTATEYAVDILTTFSGVGNLAKFRHLAKVASKANKLKFVSRTGKVVANAKTAARGAVGVIEISSGTVNALLKITDLRDEPWAKELSEFLLILELCSLGADLGEFLLKRARSSTKNALEYEDEIRNIAKKEGVEDVDGFFEDLRKVASDNIIGQGLYGGRVLSKSDIEKWAKHLKEKFGTILEKVDNFENPNILAQFDANSNTIRYRDDVTEYFMAHESFHAEEFKKIGFDEYVKDAPLRGVKEVEYTKENLIRRYYREKYVYDSLIKNSKNLGLNNEEIWHAKAYFYEIEMSLIEKNITIPK